MELRYRKNGASYIPQYKKGSEWLDVKAKHVNEDLLIITESLANTEAPPRWSRAQWYFKPTKKEDWKESAVFFRSEMYVMAFLGAFKSYYSMETKEFVL